MGPGVVLDRHVEVRGAEVAAAEVRAAGSRSWSAGRWADLEAAREPGEVEVRVRVDGGASGADVQVPVCAGRGRVAIDGRAVDATPRSSAAPIVAHVGPGAHEVTIPVRVSKYERRVACGEPVRVGDGAPAIEGLGVMAFASPYGAEGGGRAVVYVPPGHDVSRPGPALVGLHPWNGTMWTYAAYAELLAEARARDVVLLLPSGLGNSLYTADAEDEALRAIDALREVVAVDPKRVSIWGASMGGAGATTVGLHNPDRFASVTSYFGDSDYDLTTYVRGILHDAAGAHAVNALDVADNARWVPVWLVHGLADRTSPIRQSEVLDAALRQRGYDVRFDRAPGMGHAGALVARFLREVVDRAATARVPDAPARVTYRSVRPWDTGAYGVHIVRAAAEGDAWVDVELRADGVHVLRAEGVRRITIDPGALGSTGSDGARASRASGGDGAWRPPPIENDSGRPIDVGWTSASRGGTP